MEDLTARVVRAQPPASGLLAGIKLNSLVSNLGGECQIEILQFRQGGGGGKVGAIAIVLDSGKCFGFWEVFWILGSVLDSGKCFWILGSVLDSGKCFWIVGSVLDSGKCFVPMGHRS